VRRIQDAGVLENRTIELHCLFGIVVEPEKGNDLLRAGLNAGWVKDKYGLSWQIAPTILFDELFQGGDSQTDRVMRAVMTMKKLDIEDLKKAAAGK
jgi:predicted 3-demethylubiquinone-9 3-methyltransferase (glyoxalase superfamily)